MKTEGQDTECHFSRLDGIFLGCPGTTWRAAEGLWGEPYVHCNTQLDEYMDPCLSSNKNI